MRPLPGTEDLATDQDVEGRTIRRLRTLDSASATVPAGARVLDFGCGGGDIVSSLLVRGFDAYGCDLRFRAGLNRERLENSGRLLLIDDEKYRLPFDDASFDVVFSDQVLEHVQDYPSTLQELHRITRPGGLGLHIFPSRWRPIEVHVKVPFGSVIRDRTWLRLWAAAGIRNRHQSGLGIEEVVERNASYLTHNVNYLGFAELQRQFSAYFDEVRFVEREFLSVSPRARRLMSVPVLGHLIPTTYRAFRMKAVLLRKL